MWGKKNHEKQQCTAFLKRLSTDSESRHQGVAHWGYSTQGKEREAIQYIGTSKLKRIANAHMGIRCAKTGLACVK